MRRSYKSLTGIPDRDNTENGGEAVLKERHKSSDSGTITIPQVFCFVLLFLPHLGWNMALSGAFLVAQ